MYCTHPVLGNKLPGLGNIQSFASLRVMPPLEIKTVCMYHNPRLAKRQDVTGKITGLLDLQPASKQESAQFERSRSAEGRERVEQGGQPERSAVTALPLYGRR